VPSCALTFLMYSGRSSALHFANFDDLAEWEGFASTIRHSASTTTVARPSGTPRAGATAGAIIRCLLMRPQVGPHPGPRPEGALLTARAVSGAAVWRVVAGGGPERALECRTLSRAFLCRVRRLSTEM
jgi:hypothetical protein